MEAIHENQVRLEFLEEIFFLVISCLEIELLMLLFHHYSDSLCSTCMYLWQKVSPADCQKLVFQLAEGTNWTKITETSPTLKDSLTHKQSYI